MPRKKKVQPVIVHHPDGTMTTSIKHIADSRENASDYAADVIEANEEKRELPVTSNSFRSVSSTSASKPTDVVKDPRKNRLPRVEPENNLPTLPISSWNAARAAGAARRAAQKSAPKTVDDIQVTRTTRDKLGRKKKK